MPALTDIVTGKRRAPRRVLLYGTQGIGKSTWAASAPLPVFIPTEDGLEDIGAPRFPVAKSYGDVMGALAALYNGPCEFRTVAIDSADWLERLIWAEVCAVKSVSAISEIGYGKGYEIGRASCRERV